MEKGLRLEKLATLLLERIGILEVRIETLEKENQQLKAENADLKKPLSLYETPKDSHNSHLPLSSNLPRASRTESLQPNRKVHQPVPIKQGLRLPLNPFFRKNIPNPFYPQIFGALTSERRLQSIKSARSICFVRSSISKSITPNKTGRQVSPR